MATETVIIDLAAATTRSRISAVGSSQYIGFRDLIVGDNLDLTLQFQGEDGELIDLSGYTIRLSIGSPNARASGGTFTVDDDNGNVASGLAYNITAAALQTALNALDGGAGPDGDTVTVTGQDGGPWRVKWDSAGSHNLLILDPTSLTPGCSQFVSRIVTGDGSTREEQFLRIYQTPLAFQDTWTISSTSATAELSLGGIDLFTALGTATAIQRTLEIELTSGLGDITTVAQLPVVIRADLAAEGATDPVTFSTYQTQAEGDARYLLVANDLSDVNDAQDARVNLGVEVATFDKVRAKWFDGTATARCYTAVAAGTDVNEWMSHGAAEFSALVRYTTSEASSLGGLFELQGGPCIVYFSAATATSVNVRLTFQVNRATTNALLHSSASAANIPVGQWIWVRCIVDADGGSYSWFLDENLLYSSTVGGSGAVLESATAAAVGGRAGSTSNAMHGGIAAINCLNYAMTDAEWVNFIRTGKTPHEGQIGAKLYESDFSAGADSWTFSGSSGTVTGNVDSISSENDWLSVAATGSSTITAVRTAAFTAYQRNRVRFKCFNPSGSAITHVCVYDGTAAAASRQVVAIAANTKAYIDVRWRGTATPIHIAPCDASGNLATLASGQIFYIKELTVRRIGPVLAYAPGEQDVGVRDLVGSLDLIDNATGTATSPPNRDTSELRYRSATNGSVWFGGVDQTVQPAGTVLELEVINEGGSATTVQVGSTAGGSDIVGSSVLTASANAYHKLTMASAYSATARKISLTSNSTSVLRWVARFRYVTL